MRWHELDQAGRAEAVARVREWVDTVYRQQFPRAGDIAPCWADHPVCVVLLDVLSQMHAALYHGTKRSWGVVHNQAELYVQVRPGNHGPGAGGAGRVQVRPAHRAARP